MDEPDIEIPAAFWQTLPESAIPQIFASGQLDAIQCARLWKMTGRTDACPAALQLFVNRADLERAIDDMRKGL